MQKWTISKISQPRPPLKSIWRDEKNPANCNANFYLSTLLRGKTEALQTSYQQNQLTKARSPVNFWCSKTSTGWTYVHWVCETSISETRLIANSSRVAFPLIGFSDLAVLVAADGRHLMQNWYEKTFRRLDFEKKLDFLKLKSVQCTLYIQCLDSESYLLAIANLMLSHWSMINKCNSEINSNENGLCIACN